MVIVNNFGCAGVGLKRFIFIMSNIFALLQTFNFGLHFAAIIRINFEVRNETDWSSDSNVAKVLILQVIYVVATAFTVLSFGSSLGMMYGVLEGELKYLSQWAAIHSFLEIIIILEYLALSASLIFDKTNIIHYAILAIGLILNFFGVWLYYALRDYYMKTKSAKSENPWSLDERRIEPSPPVQPSLKIATRTTHSAWRSLFKNFKDQNEAGRDFGNASDSSVESKRQLALDSTSFSNTSKGVSLNGLVKNDSLDGKVAPVKKIDPWMLLTPPQDPSHPTPHFFNEKKPKQLDKYFLYTKFPQ